MPDVLSVYKYHPDLEIKELHKVKLQLLPDTAFHSRQSPKVKLIESKVALSLDVKNKKHYLVAT